MTAVVDANVKVDSLYPTGGTETFDRLDVRGSVLGSALGIPSSRLRPAPSGLLPQPEAAASVTNPVRVRLKVVPALKRQQRGSHVRASSSWPGYHGAGAVNRSGCLDHSGVIPGPLMFTVHMDLTAAIIAAFFIGNVILLIMNIPR